MDTTTTTETRHVSERINRTAAEVYAYVSQPAHWPAWAPGLGSTIEQVGGEWVMDSPMGRIVVVFAPENEFGVLDHTVTLPSGETFYNPLRVIADGPGAEIVFAVRRQPGVSDEEFERDAGAVRADLRRLKQIMEGRP